MWRQTIRSTYNDMDARATLGLTNRKSHDHTANPSIYKKEFKNMNFKLLNFLPELKSDDEIAKLKLEKSMNSKLRETSMSTTQIQKSSQQSFVQYKENRIAGRFDISLSNILWSENVKIDAVKEKVEYCKNPKVKSKVGRVIID